MAIGYKRLLFAFCSSEFWRQHETPRLTFLTFSQAKVGLGSGTSFAQAYVSNATGSSYLLALGLVGGTAAVTMGVTDSLLITWTQIGSNINDGTNTYALFQVSINMDPLW